LSANDLLVFLAATMGYTKTPLASAMKAMLAVRRPTGQPFVDTAMGWTIDTRGGNEIIWKNGGTGGYRTIIGYAPRSGVGIVALSNAETPAGVDDLGLHLLDARYPLEIPNGSPREATVDSKLLERYVGYYEGGFDIYEVKFDNGTVDWRIVLASDGKVAGVGFHKTP
jgi:CubicO group peptidase (beta-lactamase class C family)